MRASNWADETVQSNLRNKSILEVTPKGEEPFYCLGMYDTSKPMGVMESTVKNARARENSVIT